MITNIPLQDDILTQLKKKCFFNAPWYDLKNKYLELFLEQRIQPEIGLEGACLYDESLDDFQKISYQLEKRGLKCTMHAPFFDLSAGSLDPHILKISREKIHKAFKLIPIFKPRSIVCHLQFEDNKHSYVYEKWFHNIIETWHELIVIAEQHNTVVMFENTYETSPKVHKHFLQELNSNSAGFCLDVGHLMAFSKTRWQQWLPELLPWLGQLHLHDNDGNHDAHLAPGLGQFNFLELLAFLKNNNSHPIITYEPHSENDLWKTFDFLKNSPILLDI